MASRMIRHRRNNNSGQRTTKQTCPLSFKVHMSSWELKTLFYQSKYVYWNHFRDDLIIDFEDFDRLFWCIDMAVDCVYLLAWKPIYWELLCSLWRSLNGLYSECDCTSAIMMNGYKMFPDLCDLCYNAGIRQMQCDIKIIKILLVWPNTAIKESSGCSVYIHYASKQYWMVWLDYMYVVCTMRVDELYAITNSTPFNASFACLRD